MPDNYDYKLTEILKRALEMSCKMIRQNPPPDLDAYPEDMLGALCGGMVRDPEGEEFVRYFISKAIKENLNNLKGRNNE